MRGVVHALSRRRAEKAVLGAEQPDAADPKPPQHRQSVFAREEPRGRVREQADPRTPKNVGQLSFDDLEADLYAIRLGGARHSSSLTAFVKARRSPSL